MDRPDVHLLVEKGLNVEAILKVLTCWLHFDFKIIFLMQSAKYGLLKDLGDKLRSYPNSSCARADCTRLVKSGSHVYSSVF